MAPSCFMKELLFYHDFLHYLCRSMIRRLSIEEYLTQRENLVLLDVRTPAEFEKAHIPQAYNLPLFSNEERVKIGTTYKQVGREDAILLGFEFTGNKWADFIKTALKLAPEKKVGVHCWRGGMRSGAMAWALDFYGFEVSVLEGGYKSYRHWALAQFEKDYPLCVLGGMTGSHKTEILLELQKLGEQVIDLEGLAQHQGSAFGSMNRLVQPSQEHFENLLAFQLYKMNLNTKIWIEDESNLIGKILVPKPILKQIQSKILIELQLFKKQRIDFLVQEYGILDKDFLKEATIKIRKRLGYDHAQAAIEAIDQGQMRRFIEIVLVYYDKAYQRGLGKRAKSDIFPLALDFQSAAQAAKETLQFSEKINLTKFN